MMRHTAITREYPAPTGTATSLDAFLPQTPLEGYFGGGMGGQDAPNHTHICHYFSALLPAVGSLFERSIPKPPTVFPVTISL